MKKNFLLLIVLFAAAKLMAQLETSAGTWKTWFISSGREWRLSPPSTKDENPEVLNKQASIDAAGLQHIYYWNAGAPGYRWQIMMDRLWMVDTSRNGVWRTCY